MGNLFWLLVMCGNFLLQVAILKGFELFANSQKQNSYWIFNLRLRMLWQCIKYTTLFIWFMLIKYGQENTEKLIQEIVPIFQFLETTIADILVYFLLVFYFYFQCTYIFLGFNYFEQVIFVYVVCQLLRTCYMRLLISLKIKNK